MEGGTSTTGAAPPGPASASGPDTAPGPAAATATATTAAAATAATVPELGEMDDDHEFVCNVRNLIVRIRDL